jgi:hypothetical protein
VTSHGIISPEGADVEGTLVDGWGATVVGRHCRQFVGWGAAGNGAGDEGLRGRQTLRACVGCRRPRTLQEGYTWGPMLVLGGVAVSYERGTPVNRPQAVARATLD